MRILQSYFFIFFILLFSHCKKENTSINGNVWDLAFDKPVIGGNVNLVERKSTLSFESAGDIKILATSTTDNNGNFEFFFHSKAKFRNSYTYYIIFDQPDGCYSTYGTDGFLIKEKVEIEKKETNTVKMYIAPTAEIKTTVNNVSPYNNNDNITVFAKNKYSEQIILTYIGNIGKSNSDYIGVLAGNVILKWEVTKNNITTTYGDTLYLNRCEKKEYTINY